MNNRLSTNYNKPHLLTEKRGFKSCIKIGFITICRYLGAVISKKKKDLHN